MICVTKCFGKTVKVCDDCGNCNHLCGGKCYRKERRESIDSFNRSVRENKSKIPPVVFGRGYIKTACKSYREILGG